MADEFEQAVMLSFDQVTPTPITLTHCLDRPMAQLDRTSFEMVAPAWPWTALRCLDSVARQQTLDWCY